ncbi:MAG: thiamine phosphate synthase [Chitinophagales bacterium]|nr:thiamine phosphate synthase [Chitinophagales bacterium]MDW8393676.1 thiamine phosphate synthase [Chitinophagales bacterium]
MKHIAVLQYITRPLRHLTWDEQVERACRCGFRWIQLRIKQMPVEELTAIAQAARLITRRWNAQLIINDFPDVADKVGADGVHLGQQDGNPEAARRLLGADALIGLSAHNEEEVWRALSFQPDYLGIGPYRFTATKSDLAPVLGAGGFARLTSLVHAHKPHVPVLAVGGVRAEDLPDILRAGGHGAAISSAILFDGNESSTVKELNSHLNQQKLHELTAQAWNP